jgi:hypothetical protein
MNSYTTTTRAYNLQALIDQLHLPLGIPPEYVDIIMENMRAVYVQHGPSAFAMTREAALYHEGAHALIGWHEGLRICSVSITSRVVPELGTSWGGWCMHNDPPWPIGQDTPVKNDLRLARMKIAGIVGEAVAGLDKPGSAIDELVISQYVGQIAARKVVDVNRISQEEFDAFAQEYWHEKVWGVGIQILANNEKAFREIIQELHLHEKVKGRRLRDILNKVKRIAS